MSAPKTIADFIAEIARETEAPDSFVDQVGALFMQKGIPLASDGAPNAEAIRQTFLSDAQLRASTAQARQHLAELKDRLQRLGESWERQLAQVEEVRTQLEAQANALTRHAAAMRSRGSIVPGPSELQ